MNYKGEIIDNAVIITLEKYINILTKNEIKLMINGVCNVKHRIKNYKCVIDKITRFNRNNKLGAFPLNKVLNDILGYRLVIDTSLSIKDLMLKIIAITELLPNNIKNKITILDSSKNDYQAIHLYFKLNNRSYPVELQIWRVCDKKRNKDSHFEYKQNYMKWHVRETELIDLYG
ncbi:hypothetical protein [Staphylococcus argensis]|nr:hypothetical protein [Staphylococcus argensis]MCY6990292.1 hypothetical protein [Staphylococcus argensis]